MTSKSDEVSASELSYMKAQTWSLENQLKAERKSIQNLSVFRSDLSVTLLECCTNKFQHSFEDTIKEKYELLEELTNQKLLCMQLSEELEKEKQVLMYFYIF